MATTANTQVLSKLFYLAFLLVAEAGGLQVHGRPIGGGKHVWGEGGIIMREVVHARRLQSAPYCVVAGGADASKLQDALDWACGPAADGKGGGVDCSAILQTGTCYNPDTIQAHASYAFNYYYVQQSGASGSCDFGGLATTSSTDPSSGTCVYPALGSGLSTPTTPSSNFTTPTGSSNSTGFNSPTTGSTSHAGMGARFSCCWTLVLMGMVGMLLASQHERC